MAHRITKSTPYNLDYTLRSYLQDVKAKHNSTDDDVTVLRQQVSFLEDALVKITEEVIALKREMNVFSEMPKPSELSGEYDV